MYNIGPVNIMIQLEKKIEIKTRVMTNPLKRKKVTIISALYRFRTEGNCGRERKFGTEPPLKIVIKAIKVMYK